MQALFMRRELNVFLVADWEASKKKRCFNSVQFLSAFPFRKDCAGV